jgi:hypothetical protein
VFDYNNDCAIFKIWVFLGFFWWEYSQNWQLNLVVFVSEYGHNWQLNLVVFVNEYGHNWQLNLVVLMSKYGRTGFRLLSSALHGYRV